MKVALVHDYLTRFGGGERVLAALTEIWPKAPIFTSAKIRNTKYEILNTKRTSCLQHLPPFLRTSKLLVSLYPLVFENLDLSDFDVVISSGYFSKSVLTTPEQLHINYCHTVPRFLYGYPTETRIRGSRLGRFVIAPIDHKLRVWDFYSAQRPDYIVANSRTVAARVKKFWGRSSTVIYPPVETPPGSDEKLRSYNLQPTSYFLVVSRLEPYKNVDIAIKACNKLELPLKVVGEGSERKRLERLAGPTVELLGLVSDEERNRLYAGCQALIFPAQDEDFGIVPVEAMSFGKPVIALRSGGVTETVIENKTGLFFNEPTAESLAEAIQTFNNENHFHTEECRMRCLAQAQNFSKERFKKEFWEFVEEKWQNRG